jgi:hypothetical protein
VNQQFYVQAATKLKETVRKNIIFVELWLVFAPRQCIGAKSNFGPAVAN